MLIGYTDPLPWYHAGYTIKIIYSITEKTIDSNTVLWYIIVNSNTVNLI